VCPLRWQCPGAIGQPGSIADRLSQISVSSPLDARNPQGHQARLPGHPCHTSAVIGHCTNRPRDMGTVKTATYVPGVIPRVVRVGINATAIVGVGRVTDEIKASDEPVMEVRVID